MQIRQTMRATRSIPVLFAAVLLGSAAQAQNIGINTTGAVPNASAMLDIASTNRGLLIPRVALTARNNAAPVTSPATALVVYNTATASTGANLVTPGFYYWSGSEWLRMFNGKDAWSTTGNYGTVPGTNYIGTNDAKDFVVKTGGTAATNERMRVLSGGPVLINHTTAPTGAVFSVYGTGTAGAIGSTGTLVINGFASEGIGVYGESSSTSTSALPHTGVYGLAASSVGTGVGGVASSATGSTSGVTGLSQSTSGTGVSGFNTATSGQADGVYGETASPNGNAVFGSNTSASGNGLAVRGESASNNGIAVLGIGNSSNGGISAGLHVYAVQGQVNGTISGTGRAIGVLGITNSSMTTGDATGVWGQTASSAGTGVFGYASSAAAGTQPEGVYGRVSNATGIGLLGRNGNASGTAVVASGNNLAGNYLVNGSGLASTGTTTGAFHYYTSAGAGAGTIIQDAFGAQWNVGFFDGLAYYKIVGNGTVSTVAEGPNNERVLLYCPEAPEVLFQDYGTGQLTNGFAHISLDPTLTKNIIVNEEHPMKVFIQLEGDCNGVYVTHKSATGFDVKELQGGTSDAPFSWSITATRAGETMTGPNGEVRHTSYTQRFGAAPPILERRQLTQGPGKGNSTAIKPAETAPAHKAKPTLVHPE